jgi:hypothetical protein
LTSTAGKITAIKKFGDQVIVYKERAIYIGSYVGPPVVWSFQEVPSGMTGTWCQESVVSLGTPEQPLHFFVGRDDFYIFDGSRPVPVGYGIKETFFAILNTDAADKICLVADRENSRVYIYYPAGASSSNNACVVFHYRSKRWGADNRSIEFAFEFIGGSVTYSGFGAYLSNLLGATATYGGLASLGLTYETLTPKGANFQPAIFDTRNVLYTLTGSGQDATFTTSDVGTDDSTMTVTRVAPRWIVKPDTANIENYYWMNSGDTPTADTTTAMDSSNRFDFIRSAGWHRFAFSTTGDFEVSEARIEAVRGGDE